MIRVDLNKLRDENADAYSANSRHLKTRQHYIDAWNARDQLDVVAPEVLAMYETLVWYSNHWNDSRKDVQLEGYDKADKVLDAYECAKEKG